MHRGPATRELSQGLPVVAVTVKDTAGCPVGELRDIALGDAIAQSAELLSGRVRGRLVVKVQEPEPI
jgi:hypothetical protein